MLLFANATELCQGATSYEHLRTMDNIEHDTFKDACIAMGLFADDNEWHQALEEASVWALGRQLRDMFASMLMFCEATNPRQLWDAHWESLSDDIETMTCYELDDPTVTLSEDALKDRALYEIDQVLMRNGHRLEDFPTLPKSNYIPSIHGGNRLVEEELAYDQHSLTTDADNAEDRLNDDQYIAYNLNQSIGLCNGMRLIVKRLGQRVIEAETSQGTMLANVCSYPASSCPPPGLISHLFCIIVNFLFEWHLQSQSTRVKVRHWTTLGYICHLQSISHGQLYVAISQVTSSANIKIFNGQGLNGYMRNVIFKEVLEM